MHNFQQSIFIDNIMQAFHEQFLMLGRSSC